MELDEYQTLKMIQERISNKVYSFRSWADFIVWVKSITAVKFKAFILQCLDDSIADGDAKKADLLEAKTSIEG